MNLKNVYTKISSNDYIYALITRVLCIGLGFLYNILFARYFGATLKGESAVIINYASILDTFLSLGIYHAYPFYRKQRDDIYQEYLNNTISLYLFYQVGFFLLAMILPISWQLKTVFLLFPILSGTRFVNYAILVENPKRRNNAYLLQCISEVVLVVAAYIIWKPSIILLLIFIVVKELITFILSLLSASFSFKRFKLTFSCIKTYIKYGYVSMIAGLLVTLNYRVDILMLEGRVLLADIGVYSVGVNLAEKIWLLPDIIKNIMISHLSKGKGDDEVAKVLRVSTFFTLVAIIIVAAFGKPIINILFGLEYEGAYLLTLILLCGILGMMYQRLIYSYNIVNGDRMVNVAYLLIACIMNVILNYFMIPYWGVTAAALSSVVSYNLCGLLFVRFFHKRSYISYKQILFVQKEDLDFIIKKIQRK